MRDRPVSVTATCAALLWTAGLVLAVVYVAGGTPGLGVLGLYCAVGAATLTTRCYVMQLAEAMDGRERNAFDLGRDLSGPHSVD